MSYYQKDCIKFKEINKLISRGVRGSSSDRYSKAEMANTSQYDASDLVGISVNGRRNGRMRFNEKEIRIAIDAGCRFVTDNKYHRNRKYNIGEREVAQFLMVNHYRSVDSRERATWYPKE